MFYTELFGLLFMRCTLGRVDLWWVNLQQSVWFLGKAESIVVWLFPINRR